MNPVAMAGRAWHLVIPGVVSMWVVATSGAPLSIANRDPNPDEWGYRPGDGAVVPLNPPSLTWLPEREAVTYTVQWSPHADFTDVQSASGIPWPTYTHHTPLAPGTWYWRYRFTDRSGAVSGWSAVRRFVVPAEATPFPMPTPEQQRQRVPKGHPRLFVRPEDVPRLRAAARGPQATAFARLQREADRILQAGPTPEPERLGSARDKDNKELVKYWWPNRVQTERACQEAETLAFVYLLTGDAKYGQAARRWVLHLASWNPDGPTNFRLNCEAAKPMLFRPARAYDWAWDMFSDSDRATIQAAVRRRVLDAWESGEVQRGVGHLHRPYNSHGNRTWHKIGEAAVAFLDEIPEAPTWLDYAVNKFYAGYPVWADDDGGWHEGVSYWSGYMSKVVWWLQVAQVALGIEGLKKPFFAQVGDYPMYVAPPHSPNAGFGDLSHRPPSRTVGAFMDYFIRMKGNQPDGARAAYWRWWTEAWDMTGPGGILGFLYEATLPKAPPAKPPTDLPPSKVFHGIGVASLHLTLLDARDDVHLLFKSSPFGSQSHGHNPQNSFQLNAYGEPLLTTCVYRDLHGSRFHYQWAHSTRAHNAVLVDGQGQQKHVARPQGRIVAEQLSAQFDYVCGDATAAYPGRLTRARRHVVFVKRPKPVIILYDDLAAPQPATFQFMLHGLRAFTLDTAQNRLELELPRAGLRVQYLSPVPLAFRQWDGYDPPPGEPFPNQWHVEAATTQARPQMSMVTVLVPHRAGQRADWQASRRDTADGLQVQVQMADTVVHVTFPATDILRPKVNVEPTR